MKKTTKLALSAFTALSTVSAANAGIIGIDIVIGSWEGASDGGYVEAPFYAIVADIDGDGVEGYKPGDINNGPQLDAEDALLKLGRMVDDGFDDWWILTSTIPVDNVNTAVPGTPVFILVFESEPNTAGVAYDIYDAGGVVGAGETGLFTFPFIDSFATTDDVFPDFALTTVPEPTSLALLGLGGLLVARRRRG